jgi:hypothetical protein
MAKEEQERKGQVEQLGLKAKLAQLEGKPIPKYEEPWANKASEEALTRQAYESLMAKQQAQAAEQQALTEHHRKIDVEGAKGGIDLQNREQLLRTEKELGSDRFTREEYMRLKMQPFAKRSDAYMMFQNRLKNQKSLLGQFPRQLNPEGYDRLAQATQQLEAIEGQVAEYLRLGNRDAAEQLIIDALNKSAGADEGLQAPQRPAGPDQDLEGLDFSMER